MSRRRLDPWVEKAWAEHRARCMVEPHRDRRGSGLEVEFLPGRPRFRSPSSDKLGRPPFGLALLIWRAA